MIYLVNFLIITAICCLIVKNNLIMAFISLEIFILAINIQWVHFSLSSGEGTGLTVVVLLLVLAAVETTVGFSLLVQYFNLSMGDMKISGLKQVKG
jgi:NADH-quinone oxidoreductase subunit K